MELGHTYKKKMIETLCSYRAVSPILQYFMWSARNYSFVLNFIKKIKSPELRKVPLLQNLRRLSTKMPKLGHAGRRDALRHVVDQLERILDDQRLLVRKQIVDFVGRFDVD
jgi:hypothetical protein